MENSYCESSYWWEEIMVLFIVFIVNVELEDEMSQKSKICVKFMLKITDHCVLTMYLLQPESCSVSFTLLPL